MFLVLTLALFLAAVSTYIALVRDVLPQLPVEERNALGTWPTTPLHQLRVTDRAIRNAWNVHASMYPKSHKRLLFGSLLIAAALSLFGFPVWSVLR